MAETPDSPPSTGLAAARADDHGTAVLGQRDVYLDQSVHNYGDLFSTDDPTIPLVRTISAQRLPGFVGREAELRLLATLLGPDGGGGTIALSPEGDQRGIGVTFLALQAASDAVAAGWYSGGAVLVRFHRWDVRSPVRPAQVLASVLNVLGERATGRAHDDQANYHRVLGERAAAGRPVLLLVDGVTEADADLVDLLASGPHRVLVTTRELPRWLTSRRTVLVAPLTEAESFGLLTAALSVSSTPYGRRRKDSPDALWTLARRCHGIAMALRLVANELADRPDLSVAELMQELADTHDRLVSGDDSVPNGPLTLAVRLLADHWPATILRQPGGARLIGRHTLLAWLRTDCRDDRAWGWDVVGGSGMGKSTLLDAVRTDLSALGARVVPVAMGDPADGYRRRLIGSTDPITVELARMRFCMDTTELIGEANPAEWELAVSTFINLADERVRDVLAEHPDEASGPDAVSDDRNSGYVRRLAAVRASLARDLVGQLRRSPGRYVVLLDNLHLVGDVECRRWLADVVAQLAALTVVTRWPGEQTLPIAATTHRLRDFTGAEVREYLVDRLSGEQWVRQEMVDAVSHGLHGNPQAVAAFCDVLTGRFRRAAALATFEVGSSTVTDGVIIEYVSEWTRQLVAEACLEIVRRPDSDVHLLEYLVVLRHVDSGLLSKVLQVTEDQADDLLQRLSRYSMMNRQPAPDQGFGLHDQVRDHLRGTLSADRLRRRHRTVEEVYAELVAEYEPAWEPQESTAFHAWPRFEQPRFRRLLRDWLHHAMASQGEQLSTETAMRITQLFLEAFWWWGFYLKSPVCDELLVEFDLVIGDRTEDSWWLQALIRFYRYYHMPYLGPSGSGADPASWLEVDAALLQLRRRAGLEPGRPTSEAGYTIAIITGVYRAQAAAFGPNSDPDTAGELFADVHRTIRLSVAAGNTRHAWYEAWVTYLCADMWVSVGRTIEAALTARELDELAAADPDGTLLDLDLITRVLDVHAQIYLASGRYTDAVAAAARSALLTYTYHTRQETGTQPPNTYTLKRHREVIARATDVLHAVRAHDRALWWTSIRRLCEVFQTYWRLAEPEIAVRRYVPGDGIPDDGPDLPAGIIPEPPDKDSLNTRTSPFAELADRVYIALGKEADGWTKFVL